MKKQKVLLLIPLAIIAGILLYTWTTILFTGIVATWRHYMATIPLLVLIFRFFKKTNIALPGIIFYLILGTCNLLTLTIEVSTISYGVKIGSVSISTPPFQLLSFSLLIFVLIVNFDILINMYLDYKETKAQRKA